MIIQKRTSAEEQYKLILECRSSGLTDYQWCKEHGINPGTFYNWVKRLKAKACYDIPAPTGRDDYRPADVQEVVPLLILDEEPEVPNIPKVEQNTSSIANGITPVAVLSFNGMSISISNDINACVLSQILTMTGGSTC